MSKIPFPQADSLEKIIELINIEDPKDLSNKLCISALLGGVKGRQVDYYVNVLRYYGIIDDKKEFTNIGEKIRMLRSKKQLACLFSLLCTDDIVSFALVKNLVSKIDRHEIADIIQEKYNYSEISSKRRGQTIVAWVNYINLHVNFNLRISECETTGAQLLIKDFAVANLLFRTALYGYELEFDDVTEIVDFFELNISAENLIEKYTDLSKIIGVNI